MYALVWFLVNDRVKLLVHRVLDRKAPSVIGTLHGRGESEPQVYAAIFRLATEPGPFALSNL